MKKMLVVLLALSVVGGVFAADLGDGFSISGEVRTGARVETNGTKDEETLFFSWHDDAGQRARLVFAYDVDQGGAKVRISPIGDDGIGYYGWLNFGKWVTLSGGKIFDGLWGTRSGNILDDSFDSVNGVRVAIKPIDGLSIGASLPLALKGPEGTEPAKEIGDVFADTVIGAAYTADAFSASVTLDLVPDGEVIAGNGADSAVAVLFSLQVPVSAFTLDLDALFRSEGFARNNYSKDTLAGGKGLIIGARGTYVVNDALSAHLQVKVGAAGDEKGIHPVDVTVEKPEDVSFGARVHVDYKLNDTLGVLGRVGSDNFAYLDGNGLFVRLGLNVGLGGGVSLSCYDQVGKLGADEDIGGKISNAVQVSLEWNF